MGTAKRERQKANRALKLEQQAKQERVQKVKRTGTRWLLTALGLILVVLAVLWAAGVFKGGDSESSATDTATATSGVSSTATLPTTAPTFPPVSTPQVSVPEVAPTELKVTELVAGEGPKAKAGDQVSMYDVGLNAAGEEFDNTYQPPRVFQVLIGQAPLEGWNQGLVGVQKGGRYQIDIPAALAYGEAGNPPKVQPNEPVTFVVDILAVESVGG